MPHRIGSKWSLAAATLALCAGGIAAGSPTSAAMRNPTELRAISEPRLDQVAMRNPMDGYGLFTTQGTPCTYEVGTTLDGGATFSGLVTVQRCGQAAAESIVRGAGGTVFVYGQGQDLAVSHDGGRTWTELPEAGHVVQVVAVGSSVWFVETMCRAHRVGCALRVATSTDDGYSWRTGPAQPYGAVSWSQYPLSTTLVRSGQLVAYVISHPSTILQRDPMWVTTDGGQSWHERSIQCVEGGYFGLLAAAAPDGALDVVCAGQPSAGFQDKSTSVSLDQGRTWHVFGQCQKGSPHYDAHVGPICEGYLGEMAVVSSRVIFEIGDRSPLFVTRTAGYAWAYAGKVSNVNGGPAQVLFFNPHQGLAITVSSTGSFPELVWRTADGGRHWSAPRVVVP